MAVRTFAELEEQKRPRAKSVLDTLHYYAHNGSSIAPRVVLQVIQKAGLSRTELKSARRHLQAGYDNQNKRNEDIAAREYQKAMTGVDRLLQ
jgi:hypothetical protein